MTAQELSNMVFAIKDKISDKEFKDLMDKLSVKNEEEKEIDVYEFKYIKQKLVMTKFDEGVGYRIKSKIKKRNVRISDGCCTKNNIEEIIKRLREENKCFYILNIMKKDDKYILEVINHLNKSILNNPTATEYDFEKDEEEKLNVLIHYDSIIPISLELLK